MGSCDHPACREVARIRSGNGVHGLGFHRYFLRTLLLISCATCYASAQSTSAVKGMRHPVPLHVMRWSDKLKVQPLLDAALAEITQNGTKPLDAQCNTLFGMGYLEKWKAAKKDVCKPGGKSTYTCYEHPPHDHGQNIGSLFCHATNLILNSDDFLGEVITKQARYPTPRKGSAKVACSLADPLPWTKDQVADQHTDRWLYDALAPASDSELTAACDDPRRSVAYPVYFVTRMDPTNAFHHFEEVVNFFSALWMFPDKELLQQGITVVAFDGAPYGFYLELWRRIAYPYRLRFLRSRPYPPGTCFKHVLIASMPHRSLYTHFWPGRMTNCRSVVFTAIMKWAHALMSDVRPESYGWPEGQQTQNSATVVGRVTWVSRRHFEAANRGSFTGWQSQRMIGNDDSVVAALAGAVREWNSRSCLRDPAAASCRRLPVYFEFGSMELGDHRWYPDQLSILSCTNVLVAIHGAGVFNEVWLRPSTGAVLEITHNSGGNHHYRNIAAFLGLPYTDHHSAHDPTGLAAKLTQLLDGAAQRMVEVAQRDRAEAVAAAVAAEEGGGGKVVVL